MNEIVLRPRPFMIPMHVAHVRASRSRNSSFLEFFEECGGMRAFEAMHPDTARVLSETTEHMELFQEYTEGYLSRGPVVDVPWFFLVFVGQRVVCRWPVRTKWFSVNGRILGRFRPRLTRYEVGTITDVNGSGIQVTYDAGDYVDLFWSDVRDGEWTPVTWRDYSDPDVEFSTDVD